MAVILSRPQYRWEINTLRHEHVIDVPDNNTYVLSRQKLFICWPKLRIGLIYDRKSLVQFKDLTMSVRHQTITWNNYESPQSRMYASPGLNVFTRSNDTFSPSDTNQQILISFNLNINSLFRYTHLNFMHYWRKKRLNVINTLTILPTQFSHAFFQWIFLFFIRIALECVH